MNRLIRWYNRNRKVFWLSIAITVIVIWLPRALNEYAKDKKSIGSSINNTTTYNNNSYSVITGEKVKEETNTENANIINTFIEYCNNQNKEEAYELLSDECKQILYPTLDDFTNKYYNKIFENKKSYNIQAWISDGNFYTYKINLKDDMLSTGNADSSSIEDYYTIVKENSEYKLNINSYIGNVEINKFNETDELKVLVLNKDVFMEYEIYNLSVESKIGKSILLDSLEKVNGMYLEDDNGLHYNSYSHEIVIETLRVRAIKNIGIKFNKKYSNQNEIEKIVFSDILLDYDEYYKYSNKLDYTDRISLAIEF